MFWKSKGRKTEEEKISEENKNRLGKKLPLRRKTFI